MTVEPEPAALPIKYIEPGHVVRYMARAPFKAPEAIQGVVVRNQYDSNSQIYWVSLHHVYEEVFGFTEDESLKVIGVVHESFLTFIDLEDYVRPENAFNV